MILTPNLAFVPKVVGSCHIDLAPFAASPEEHWTYILCLFFCGACLLVVIRVNLLRSSTYLTGWLRRLLWLLQIRICSHLRDCEHI